MIPMFVSMAISDLLAAEVILGVYCVAGFCVGNRGSKFDIAAASSAAAQSVVFHIEDMSNCCSYYFEMCLTA